MALHCGYTFGNRLWPGAVRNLGEHALFPFDYGSASRHRDSLLHYARVGRTCSASKVFRIEAFKALDVGIIV